MLTKSGEMTETLAHGYIYDSTPKELSNEYQHDRVWMNFINICLLVHMAKVAQHQKGYEMI